MRKILVVLGVLLLLAVVAVAGFLYAKARGKVALDPVEVERMAARMLPGAAPPTGFRGVLGLHLEGVEVAIFAPGLAQVQPDGLSGSDLRIVIAQPQRQEDGPRALEEVRTRVAEVQKRKAEAMETLQQDPVELAVGGRPHPAQKSLERLKDDGRRLQGYTLLLIADRHPVVVQILGPEQGFNQAAMEQFLAPLKVAPGLPGGRPGAPGGKVLQRLEERREGGLPPGAVERRVEQRVEERVEQKVEERVEERAAERALPPPPGEPLRERIQERREAEGRPPVLPRRRGQ